MHGVVNPDQDGALTRRAADVQREIQSRYADANRSSLLAIPTLRSYSDYYRRFGKTYHVQLQLESILFKARPITGPSAIVHAMFIAELRNMLLTAGHDLDAVRGGLIVDVSVGDERYTLLNGVEQELKPDDMYIRDEVGILSSIIYGPDHRTRITPATRAVIFTVYAPAGISSDEVERHLADLEANVRLFSPQAEVEARALLGGS